MRTTVAAGDAQQSAHRHGGSARADKSWRVTPRVLATPVVAALGLVCAIAVLEWAARSTAAATALPIPSVGGSALLDIQMAQLDAFAREHGGVDCIIIGSSLVLQGIDPAAFSDGFADRSGRRLHCYNAAHSAMIGADAGIYARLLAEDYHPWLLLYGVSPRDLSGFSRGPDFEHVPWTAYRDGEFTLDGWLVDHLKSYRYLLAAGEWFDPERRRLRSLPNPLRPDGFQPATRSAGPYPQRDKFAYAMAEGQFQPGLAPQSLTGLERVGDLHGSLAQVAVVEIPVHPANQQWLRDHAELYDAARREIRERTSRRGALTIEGTSELPLVADESSWNDVWHFNSVGAARFGRWLGERIAEAVARGDLRAPPPEPEPR